MDKFFEKLNQLSYRSVFFIASFLTVTSVLPLWLYINSQQTNLVTKAVQTKPVIPLSKPTEGPVPANPPIITRVYPWVGKPGDSIIIEGKNFGTYPKNRRLSIGNVVVPDTLISDWQDTRIEAEIPTRTKQGAPVAIRIDMHPIIESIPLTFYDATTTVRIKKSDTHLTIDGLTTPVHGVLYTQQGKREVSIPSPTGINTELFTLSPSEEIQSILLTDDKGTVIPYSINPTEFGF